MRREKGITNYIMSFLSIFIYSTVIYLILQSHIINTRRTEQDVENRE